MEVGELIEPVGRNLIISMKPLPKKNCFNAPYFFTSAKLLWYKYDTFT